MGRTRPAGRGVPVAADPALVAAVTERLAAAADPGRAPQMQAYMKSDMPYLGVAVPSVRAVTTAAARDHPPASVDELAATAAAWGGRRPTENTATRPRR